MASFVRGKESVDSRNELGDKRKCDDVAYSWWWWCAPKIGVHSDGHGPARVVAKFKGRKKKC